MELELSIVRGSSIRLLIPKRVIEALGWSAGDLIEFRVRGDVAVLNNLGKAELNGAFSRRLRKFGGSFAVTLPLEVRDLFAESVRARVEGNKLVIWGCSSENQGIRED